MGGDIRIEINNPAGGGLNDVLKPDLLEKEVFQQIDNYEIKEDGYLEMRTDPETYDANLNSAIIGVLDSVLNISEPYYPSAKPSDMYNDFVLLVFGQSGSDYKVYAFYQDSATTWNATEISITNCYSTTASGTDVDFEVGENRVLILDRNEDSEIPVCYYAIDEEGSERYGVMGLPAPKTKAEVTQITAWNENDWETNENEAKVSTPGLVQIIYTVATKDGDESNPSPISETLDMQFFEFDTDGNDARWINRVKISNLSMPTVANDVKKLLKYFNVYYRVFRYSEGDVFKNFEFAQQFEISDKENQDDTATGNSYVITVETEVGNYASYENDIAPVAKTGCEIGGVTFVGNCRTKIKFPFEFYYYCPITLTNNNPKTYVDAVVAILIQESDVDSLEWDYYDVNSDNIIDTDKINLIRLYDSDLTTPLNAIYQLDTANNYCNIFVKVPLLEAGNSHTIYLCFNNASHYLDGVDNADYQTHEYGQWMINNSTSFDTDQKVFNGERVRNVNSKICSNANFLINKIAEYTTDTEWTEKAPNKCDLDKNGFIHTSSLNSKIINRIYIINNEFGRYSFYNLSNLVLNYSRYFSDHHFTDDVVYKFSIWFRLYFDLSLLDTSEEYLLLSISSNDTDDPFSTHHCYIHLFLSYSSGWYFKLYNKHFDGGDITDDFYTFSAVPITSGYFDSVLLSIDTENGYASVFAHSSEYYYEEDATFSFNDFSKYPISSVIFEHSNNTTPVASYMDNPHFIINNYFSAGDTDNIASVYNIFNFMPAFDDAIGYKYSTTPTFNNNITFGDTKTAVYKDHANMLKWSNINGLCFPDLFYKFTKEPIMRVISAPSFLKLQYANTVIVFTRNQIFRFVLSGSPDEWTGQAQVLNEQYSQYGLLAKKSLVKAGNKLFWLSEVGIIMWDEEGFHLISKDRVDVELNEDAIGFYCPIRNQYIVTNGFVSSLSVTAPNGGESYTIYSSQNITWTAVNVLYVKLSYSINNGSGWVTISESISAILGTYSWTLPGTPSTKCLVKISSVENPDINDMSDGVFTISAIDRFDDSFDNSFY